MLFGAVMLYLVVGSAFAAAGFMCLQQADLPEAQRVRDEMRDSPVLAFSFWLSVTLTWPLVLYSQVTENDPQ